jgi:hypothetical protein
MEELTLVLVAILIFCLTFYIAATQVRTYRKLKQITAARRVLLVTQQDSIFLRKKIKIVIKKVYKHRFS